MKDVTKHISTSKVAWKSRLPGISYIALHTDPEEKMGTFVYKMEPNAIYPRHRHQEGEEIFILKGSLDISGAEVKPGDYYYTASGTVHTMKTTEGCLFLLTCPKPVTLIPDKEADDYTSEEGLASLEMGQNPRAATTDQPVEYNNRDLTPEVGATESLDLDKPPGPQKF